MPKARDLIEAYNNFVVEPLKTEEEFKDFYVKRPENAPSPIEPKRRYRSCTGLVSESRRSRCGQLCF
ncbi:MAG: hypothetical protein ACNYVW_01200 [Methanosarcinales archaeon]